MSSPVNCLFMHNKRLYERQFGRHLNVSMTVQLDLCLFDLLKMPFADDHKK